MTHAAVSFPSSCAPKRRRMSRSASAARCGLRSGRFARLPASSRRPRAGRWPEPRRDRSPPTRRDPPSVADPRRRPARPAAGAAGCGRDASCARRGWHADEAGARRGAPPRAQGCAFWWAITPITSASAFSLMSPPGWPCPDRSTGRVFSGWSFRTGRSAACRASSGPAPPVPAIGGGFETLPEQREPARAYRRLLRHLASVRTRHI